MARICDTIAGALKDDQRVWEGLRTEFQVYTPPIMILVAALASTLYTSDQKCMQIVYTRLRARAFALWYQKLAVGLMNEVPVLYAVGGFILGGSLRGTSSKLEL
jgi:hypothetical protein